MINCLLVMTKITKIGFDLDGVLARHYLDCFWFKVRRKKEKKATAASPKYFYPKNRLERFILAVIKRSRKISSSNQKKIKALSSRGDIKIYLVTARFSFLQKLTLEWLMRNKLLGCFSQIFINEKDQDPVCFKSSVIDSHQLDVFIDDDLEVLKRLALSTKARLVWLVPSWRKIKENDHHQIVAVNSIDNIIGSIKFGNVDIDKKVFPSQKPETD